MRFLTLSVFCLFSIQVCYSLICETCDGASCLDPDRLVGETCPPSAKYCYRYTNMDKVFRRGCASMECDQQPGIPQGAVCNTCDSDRCNGIRLSHRFGPGGGGVWNSAPAHLILSHLIAAAAIFTIVL